MRASEIEQVAYHEAGHFVALYVLFPGQYRSGISIKPSEDSAGRCGGEELCDHSSEQVVADYVVTLLAGFAAQVERDPSCAARAELTASDDLQRAERAVPEARARHMGRATALLRDHWAKVEIVATALLDWEADDGSACEVLCELVDTPQQYHDAIRTLALLGRLPTRGEVVLVPPWLARLNVDASPRMAGRR